MFLPFEGRANRNIAGWPLHFARPVRAARKVVSLIGAAGVGKTRLIDAFQAWVALELPGVEDRAGPWL